MKLLNEPVYEKLGYTQVRERLAARTATEEGKALALRLLPLPSPADLQAELSRTAECHALITFDEDFSFDYTYSVTAWLEEASVAGAWLNPDELLGVMKWLRMVRGLLHFFRSRQERFPALWALAGSHAFTPDLLKTLEQALDESGELRDQASPKLAQLRREKQSLSSDLRRLLHRILRHAQSQGWSPDGEATLRSDRLVIPLYADFKGRVPGFVHDVSASGQTLFLEPSESLDLNNRVRAVLAAEKNEIRRILVELTTHLRNHIPALTAFSGLVTHLDLLRAKARLAQDTQSVLPRVEFAPKSDASQRFFLLKARHPLLLLREGKTSRVVPLTLELDSRTRILLISGPNAGGKSVSLKTVGLLQLMLQSGMLVPCDESSEFRWFEEIFIDIGDEQSIQSDLSTYTSHLANMRRMLEGLNGNSLFLLDEFGGGTDPRLGGAIAEAFLERFLHSGAMGVITTHYGNLKSFADKRSGIRNAAMQFDPETLSPTYQIVSGMPGRSYAFEIARKAGIPEDVLQDAETRLDQKELYSEDLLLKLEAQRHELDRVLEDNKRVNEELRGLLERNQHLNQEIKDKKNSILNEARSQAQNLIREANAKIERTIKEIREAQAEREITKNLRKELAAMLPEVPAEEREEAEAEAEFRPQEMPGGPLTVGDWVKLKNSSSWGQILDIQGNRAVVTLGEMRITVKIRDLVRIQPPDAVAGSGRVSAMLVEKKAHASYELDVMGLRVEACLPVLAKFMDDAILSGMKEVRILHGKGGGALRQAIRDYLRQHYQEVIRAEDGHADHGGPGWTVVTLK